MCVYLLEIRNRVKVLPNLFNVDGDLLLFPSLQQIWLKQLNPDQIWSLAWPLIRGHNRQFKNIVVILILAYFRLE